MPNATVDPNETTRRDLKSLEGAWIEVRPLPYGMVLQRRDKASRMYMEANPQVSRKQATKELARFEIETMNEWATLFDYKYCIVDHNLEDAQGNKLDLGSPMVLKLLNPKVGTELDTIISDLNDLEEDEDFTPQLSSSFQDGEIELQSQTNVEDLVKQTNTT